jgi:hypothetical protein
MQLTYRGRTPLYGKTLQGVLGKRPCRVLVVADPTAGGNGDVPEKLAGQTVPAAEAPA